MAKIDKPNLETNKSALEGNVVTSDNDIKSADLKSVQADLKPTPELSEKESAIVQASAPTETLQETLQDAPLETSAPTPQEIATTANTDINPVSKGQMDTIGKAPDVAHQMLWPGRELKPSHQGIIGEVQQMQIDADKNNQHVLAAGLHALLNKLGDAMRHVDSMGSDASHEVISKLKSLLHGKQES